MKLEIQKVACGYEAGNSILKDITFEVNAGEICCIVGPNGVGKSTLFKTILHLLPVLEGRICINGEDTKSWNAKRISNVMAYVAQAHIPTFPYAAKDIVMMGRMGQIPTFGQPSFKDYEIVEQAMEDVGIRHLRDKIYTEISGGERQLLMIARALAQQPQILILDEPTANLDYGNMIKVMERIFELAKKGLCVIFTSHIPDQAFLCQAKTVMLYRNDPMEFGDCNKVITDKNLYRAYGARVQILEVISSDGRSIRVCAPRFEYT